MAQLFVYLHKIASKQQRLAAKTRDPRNFCRAKISVIGHSMGSYVVQKGLKIAAERLNSPQLITLVHKLAGTAALFGEPDLGDCAAALEYALTHGETNASVEALANDLLMLADAAGVPDRQVGGR